MAALCNTPVKRKVRKRLLDLGKLQPSSLWLPGPRCYDIKQGLANGILSKRSARVLAVERDLSVIGQMRRTLQALRFKFMPAIYAGELEHLQLKSVLSRLPLNFAFLDFGGLTAGLCRWMQRELVPVLAPGSFVTATVLRTYRRNRFMPALLKSDILEDGDLMAETEAECPGITHVANVAMSCIKACLWPYKLRVLCSQQYANGLGDGPRKSHLFSATFEVCDTGDGLAISECVRLRLAKLLSY